MVPGPGGRQEGPDQFLWRGRLWKVNDVVAHWVETGAWWQSGGARAVLGSDDETGDQTSDGAGGGTAVALGRGVDLLGEREVWRVQAGRGLAAAGKGGGGVFDLVFDWADGSWRLARCAD
jgi:hypothetical protein